MRWVNCLRLNHIVFLLLIKSCFRILSRSADFFLHSTKVKKHCTIKIFLCRFIWLFQPDSCCVSSFNESKTEKAQPTQAKVIEQLNVIFAAAFLISDGMHIAKFFCCLCESENVFLSVLLYKLKGYEEK